MATRVATAAAELATDATLCRDFSDLLEQELDGVVIATPSALHATQAIADVFGQAGKDHPNIVFADMVDAV